MGKERVEGPLATMCPPVSPGVASAWPPQLSSHSSSSSPCVTPPLSPVALTHHILGDSPGSTAIMAPKQATASSKRKAGKGQPKTKMAEDRKGAAPKAKASAARKSKQKKPLSQSHHR